MPIESATCARSARIIGKIMEGLDEFRDATLLAFAASLRRTVTAVSVNAETDASTPALRPVAQPSPVAPPLPVAPPPPVALPVGMPVSDLAHPSIETRRTMTLASVRRAHDHSLRTLAPQSRPTMTARPLAHEIMLAARRAGEAEARERRERSAALSLALWRPLCRSTLETWRRERERPIFAAELGGRIAMRRLVGRWVERWVAGRQARFRLRLREWAGLCRMRRRLWGSEERAANACRQHSLRQALLKLRLPLRWKAIEECSVVAWANDHLPREASRQLRIWRRVACARAAAAKRVRMRGAMSALRVQARIAACAAVGCVVLALSHWRRRVSMEARRAILSGALVTLRLRARVRAKRVDRTRTLAFAAAWSASRSQRQRALAHLILAGWRRRHAAERRVAALLHATVHSLKGALGAWRSQCGVVGMERRATRRALKASMAYSRGRSRLSPLFGGGQSGGARDRLQESPAWSSPELASASAAAAAVGTAGVIASVSSNAMACASTASDGSAATGVGAVVRTVEASAIESSVAEASVVEASVAEASVAEASVAEASVTEASVAEASVAKASVAKASTAETPAPDRPTRAAEATVEPANVDAAEACKSIPTPRATVTGQPTSPMRAENRALRSVLMECSPAQAGRGGAQALIDLAAEALASPCAPIKHQHPPSRPSRLRHVHSQPQHPLQAVTSAADATQLLDALVSHGRAPRSLPSPPAKGEAQTAAAMVQLRHRLALDVPTASYSYLGLSAAHRNPTPPRDQHQVAQPLSPVRGMR